MEPELLPSHSYLLLGCIYYGKIPVEYSPHNEIAELWKRTSRLLYEYQPMIDPITRSRGVAYEIHIETKEFLESQKYLVFAGIEIEVPEFVPLELFVKRFPESAYLKITTKVFEHTKVEPILIRWMEETNYTHSYPYVVQSYDQHRFKGVDDESSEIDWLIPVKPKEDRK